MQSIEPSPTLATAVTIARYLVTSEPNFERHVPDVPLPDSLCLHLLTSFREENESMQFLQEASFVLGVEDVAEQVYSQ